jgi:hypothetical protein
MDTQTPTTADAQTMADTYDPTMWGNLEEAYVESLAKAKENLAAFKALKKAVAKELRNRRQAKKGGVHKRQRTGEAPAGFNIPVNVNQGLAALIGLPMGVPVQRREITKAISKYTTENNIKNQDNKREFLLHLPHAKKFASFFPGYEGETGHADNGRLGFFNLQKAIKETGLVTPLDKADGGPEPMSQEPSPAPSPSPAPVDADAPKKKVIRKVVRPKSATTAA